MGASDYLIVNCSRRIIHRGCEIEITIYSFYIEVEIGEGLYLLLCLITFRVVLFSIFDMHGMMSVSIYRYIVGNNINKSQVVRHWR